MWAAPSILSAIELALRSGEFDVGSFEEHDNFIAIKSSQVDAVITDNASQTLLITLILSQNILGEASSSILFHPVLDETFTNHLKSRVLPVRIDRSARNQTAVQMLDNAAMTVFGACSKVTHFYADTARWLLGSQEARQRPPKDGRQPSNPWITRRVTLNNGRFTLLGTGPADHQAKCSQGDATRLQ